MTCPIRGTTPRRCQMPASSMPTTARRASRIALTAAGLLVALGSAASGQRVGGSIGVSLTVLQPVSTQAVRIVGFGVDRSGLATVETSAPSTASVSQIVMASVSDGSGVSSPAVPARRAPATNGSPSVGYVVDLGAVARPEAARQPVQLRLQYLTVAGT
jgi:hypothetical protein